jgi:dTDP-4-dehydrorhamnose 3,5-epimerase
VTSIEVTPMGVLGAWLCTPVARADERGSFQEWFRIDHLAAATGRPFRVAQANHSVSARGVVRGVHYADVPPGQAKLVYCPAGSVRDLVVDLRMGSPTFGVVETVVLDSRTPRAVFLEEGLGHAFRALEDNSAVVYLISEVYDPSAEHAVSINDPAFSELLTADGGDVVLSDRDAAAPGLSEAAEQGLLPTFVACQEHASS